MARPPRWPVVDSTWRQRCTRPSAVDTVACVHIQRPAVYISSHSTAPTPTQTPTRYRLTRHVYTSLRPIRAISSRGSSRGCRCPFRCRRRNAS